MAKLMTEFNYPIVLKYIHGFLTISIPDLGIDAKIPMSQDFYQSQKLAQNKDEIWRLLVSTIEQATKHIETKKWVPDASQIKSQLKAPEQDFSLPEFCREVSKYITISENTLRREISRGKIICYTTEGGHRRIPASEVQRYLKDCNQLRKQNEVDI
jgi:excisionase family DNA binding protein